MKKRHLLLALTALLTLVLPALAGETEKQPAFPGAEGFGRYVTGGRGGAVYHVTNLNDSGDGSLRWAVGQSGTRTVVFDVSGTIHLLSELAVTNGNLTIAGQTAPGDGICVADFPFTINANNVIVRYMRFRLGNKNVSDENDGWDGLGSLDHKNLMIDHCSVSWSIDECLSISGCENVTVQWCLVAQSLQESGHSKGAHGYGGNWGGKRSSYHHNLMAHHGSRTPRLGPRPTTQMEEYMDMRNNVIYNWAGNGCYGGEGMKVNIVNNYYKPGPATKTLSSVKQKRIAAVGVRTTQYITTYPAYTDAWHLWGKYYVDGNVNPNHSDVTGDNWTYGVYNQVNLSGDDCDGTWTSETKDSIRLDAPLDHLLTTTHTAAQAYELVMLYAGASLSRDSHDATMVSDTRNATATYTGSRSGILPGMIDSQDESGGWPTLASTSAPDDTDGDGMPDEWEDQHGLDKNDASDGPALGDDGYTHLENYLNSLVADITTAQNTGGTASGTIEYASEEMNVSDDYQLTASTKAGESTEGKNVEWTFEDDFTITNASSKAYATGNYNTIKFSSGTQYAINIPNGLAIEKVVFAGYGNNDTADAYLSELGGTKYGSTDYTFRNRKTTTEDEQEIVFSNAVTKRLTFTAGGTQACWKITLCPVKNEATAATDTSQPSTTTATITLPFYDGSTNFTVNYSDEAQGKVSANVTLGAALGCSAKRTVNGAQFNEISTTEKKTTEGSEANALTIGISTADDATTFKPTKIGFNACKVGSNGGAFSLSVDGTTLYTAEEPSRNNEESGWYSTYTNNLNTTAATEHSIVFNILKLDGKNLGLGNIVITGDLTTTGSGGNDLRSVVLKENARTLGVETGAANVKLQRKLGTSYNTLCLPFSLSAEQMAAVWGKTELYEFTAVNGTVMRFDLAHSIEAGKPYIIKVENEVAEPEWNDVDISVTSPTSVSFGGYSFAGTFTRHAMQTDGTELMMQTSGELAKPTAAPNNWMKGMRAYFVVPASQQQTAKVFFMGITDTLDSIGIEATTDNAPVYNLSGQRMGANAHLGKGIYISNGKKIVRK